MKKIFSFLLVLFTFMFLNNIKVSATDMKFDNNSIAVGKSAKLTISNPTRTGDYTIDYDENVLSIKNNCGTKKILLHNKMEKSCTVEFTAKSDLKLEDDKKVTIEIKDDGGSKPETIDLTIKANTTKTPSTSATVATTTSGNDNKTTTTANQKSNNAKLKELKITSLDNVEISYTPNFSSSINEYSVNVKSDVEKININAVLDDSNASFVISDNIKDELKAGENTKITVVVTAEDGQTKNTYTLNVLREALETDATLKKLKIKEDPSFKFDENVFSYNINVSSDIDKLTIDYETVSNKSSVSISGNNKLKNNSVVKITVTSEDGTKREYKLTILKTKKTVTTEKIVTVSSGKSPIVIGVFVTIAVSLIASIIYVIKK